MSTFWRILVVVSLLVNALSIHMILKSNNDRSDSSHKAQMRFLKHREEIDELKDQVEVNRIQQRYARIAIENNLGYELFNYIQAMETFAHDSRLDARFGDIARITGYNKEDARKKQIRYETKDGRTWTVHFGGYAGKYSWGPPVEVVESAPEKEKKGSIRSEGRERDLANAIREHVSAIQYFEDNQKHTVTTHGRIVKVFSRHYCDFGQIMYQTTDGKVWLVDYKKQPDGTYDYTSLVEVKEKEGMK